MDTQLNKKIFLIIPTLTVGGAENIFINIYNEIKKNGYNVSIILLKNKIELENTSDMSILVLDNIFDFIRFVKENRNNGMFFSFMERANIYNILSAMICKSNSTLSVHTAPKSGFKKRKKHKLILIKLFYKLAAIFNVKVIAVSCGIKTELHELFGIKNCIVIPNFIAVDGSTISNLRQKEHTYPITISFVGRLNKVKGCDILLKAINKSKKLLSKKINVNIIGSGPEFNNLSNYCRENQLSQFITFHGSLSNSETINILKKSHYLVNSSYAEGFGLVILEGLISGCSIIYSKCDFGPKDILENNFTNIRSFPFIDPTINDKLAVDELSDILSKLTPYSYNYDEIEHIKNVFNNNYAPKKIVHNIINYLSK